MQQQRQPQHSQYQYGLLPFFEPQKNSCAFIAGRCFTAWYLVFQSILLFGTYFCITHHIILLYSGFGWTLITIQLAINFLIGFMTICAYGFDFVTWQRFKSGLSGFFSFQIVTHVGTPLVFLLLRTISTEDEQKFWYETLILIFGILMLLDSIFMLPMVLPYYSLFPEAKREYAEFKRYY